MAPLTQQSDDELLTLLRGNDELAFAEIYRRYWKKIFTLAANGLDSPEEAEECVQDIFCSLWRRRGTIELKYSIYTYLAVAVKYQVINRLDKAYRLQQRMAGSRGLQPEVYAPSAETPLLEKELFGRLNDSVNRLPEKCRIVFKMSREEGKSHKEIAEELQISEKTVNNHLTKALKDLKTDLSPGLSAFLVWCLLHRL